MKTKKTVGRNDEFHRMRRGLTGGQEEALLRKVWLAGGGDKGGDAAVHDLLTGKLWIVLQDASILLVDSIGRCIPLHGMKGAVVDANRNFRFVQPEINYAAILGRLQQFLPDMQFVSAAEFEQRGNALLAQVRGDEQVKNLLKGVHLPLVFPKLQIADYGRTLEEIFLAAVKRSYEAAFPGRMFYNHFRAGTLAGQVTIAEGTRHEKLIEKMADGPVVGIWFANPLQGFGIQADREMIVALGEGYILSGAIEAAVALVADPETFARDFHVPALDCVANIWQSAGRSLCFCPYGGRLGFHAGGLDAYDCCSGGLLFLGSGSP